MLIVTHTDLPLKMLKGLVFIFVAFINWAGSRSRNEGNAPLAVGGMEAVLEVGVAQQVSTLPRPAAEPCFSSVVVQISFQWGL